MVCMYHMVESQHCNAYLALNTPNASTAEGAKKGLESSKLLHQRNSIVRSVLFISASVRGIS